MGFEFATGLIALLAMAATVAGKVVTARLLAKAHQRIHDASRHGQELLRAHHVDLSKRKVVETNLASLQKKQITLEGRRSHLQEELAKLGGEGGQRDTRQVGLVSS